MVIINHLVRAGAKIKAHDPVAVNEAYKIFKKQNRAPWTTAMKPSAGLTPALVTEWNEFRTPDFQRMKKLMKTPVIFDGRNIYSRRAAENGIHLLRHRKKMTNRIGSRLTVTMPVS